MLTSTGCDTVSPIFIQFVGHSIFKELIKKKYCPNNTAECNHGSDLTHLEYTAGYVPWALKKKVAKSSHLNKNDLLEYLDDLLMCEDEDPGPSADWINAVDHGGLIHINNMTFELFLSMERGCVKAGQEICDIRYRLKDNEEVLFYWSILTAERTNDVATTILEMIVHLWITVRGGFIGWCMG